MVLATSDTIYHISGRHGVFLSHWLCKRLKELREYMEDVKAGRAPRNHEVCFACARTFLWKRLRKWNGKLVPGFVSSIIAWIRLLGA